MGFSLQCKQTALLVLRCEQAAQVSYENVDMGHINLLISEGFPRVGTLIPYSSA